MNLTLLIAVIAATVLSACYAQGNEPDGAAPSCQTLMHRFSFLMCNDSSTERSFQQRQCETHEVCYCVDPASGDRIDGMSYTREEFARINCNSNDDGDNNRRNMMCPDLTDTISICGGRNCIRRPNNNETCLQCIQGCTDDGQAPRCSRDSECGEGETCITSGDLGRPDCMDVRIQEGGVCIPDDNEDDVEDDDDVDDEDYDDDEETFFEGFIRNFDRRSELGEIECADNLVCRRNGTNIASCQPRTGPCFENNGRPTGSDSSAPQLECDDDSGNFEAQQNSDTEQWCVFPMNGMEIPGTRRDMSRSLDCNRMVFQSCRIMINGRQYTVEHDEEAINFNMMRDMCGLCRCNNGSFASCSPVECPYIRDDAGSRACTVNGRMIPHRMTYQDECNVCRCINGNVLCTLRDCSDDEDDDDDGIDEDNDFAECRRMPYSPVCATNMCTYPNKCTALAAGFERFEIAPGACSRDRICQRFPCMDGYRCVPLAVSCARRNCTGRDFRRCINTTRLICRAELDLRMEERVCGTNNRTYPSICHMVQQSDTQIRFPGACDRSDCPDGLVCGSDGVTYRSLCDIRLQADVRFDYRGMCMDVRDETVRDFCARVRSSNRCATRQNCNTTVRPTDGCCPVCGGGVSVGIDGEAFERFSEEFDDARTTSEIRRRITDSGIVRDTSDKCSVKAQFSSNGNIELLYEAKADKDASACAAKAMMTANNINNLGGPNASRRRRQTEEDDADPIFNLVTSATALETTTTGPANPPGGSASIIVASYYLLLALTFLVVLML